MLCWQLTKAACPSGRNNVDSTAFGLFPVPRRVSTIQSLGISKARLHQKELLNRPLMTIDQVVETDGFDARLGEFLVPMAANISGAANKPGP